MAQRITSLHNARVKAAAKLRQRRSREKQGRIIVDGRREIQRALTAELVWREAYVNEAQQDDEPVQEIVAALTAAGVHVLPVAPGVFQKVNFGEREDGIVAIADAPSVSLDGLKLPADPLVAVLEGVEKPGNVGAVIRTADAAGFSAVAVADAGTDVYNPNTIRASLGAVFTTPVVSAASAEVLRWLQEQEIAVFAARVDGQELYTEIDYRPGSAIVLGSEAAGLGEVWTGAGVTAVKLPMLGAVDSLNVSAAAAVLAYEARRQRGLP